MKPGIKLLVVVCRLTVGMKNSDYILNELQEIAASLLNVNRTNVYSVDPAYFSNLSTDIIQKIQAGKEPIYHFSKGTPYAIPEDYFDNLAGKILKRIKTDAREESVFEEMEQLSPLLNTISKKPVMSVPAGYFKEIKIPATTESSSGKVVRMSVGKRIARFSIAAIVAALSVVGAYMMFDNNNPATPKEAATATAQVKSLSEQEIVDFLKTTSAPDDASVAIYKQGRDESEISRSLSKISDKELRQFLQENGETEGI